MNAWDFYARGAGAPPLYWTQFYVMLAKLECSRLELLWATEDLEAVLWACTPGSKL